LSSLDTRIEKVCWRISARLNSGKNTGGEAGSVMEYIDLHTKLVDLAHFHREHARFRGGDEEVVYRAICFMEEVLLTPFSGASESPRWFYNNLHTLLVIASGNGSMCKETKRFLNDLTTGIEKMKASEDSDATPLGDVED
jgi:hypothetical protein